MERHAAVPDGDDVGWLGDVVRQVVEEDVADAAAGDDAERRPHHEIVEVDRRQRRAAGPHRRVGDQPLGVPPGEEDAGDVGERVPADRERADGDQHRIDGGEGQRQQASAIPAS